MDKSKKRHSKLIIACSDPAKNFEFIEETLNQMMFFISVEITEPRLEHIAFGWDRIRCSLLCDVGANGLCSVCFITQNVASGNFHFRKQINGGTGIKDVTAGKQKTDRISQSIHNSVDFCSLSTMTYTDKLVVFRIYIPLFAPALCGCALMLVLSIHRFSYWRLWESNTKT